MQRIFGLALAAGALVWAGVLTAAPAVAQVHGIQGVIDCDKKDSAMFKRMQGESAAAMNKIKNVDENALAKQPEKYCAWLKVQNPIREQWQQQFETRLAGECGPDPIVEAALYNVRRMIIFTRRRIDSACLGVLDY